MNRPSVFAIVLGTALGIALASTQRAHADPVGPPPLPPVGSAFGPPGWAPPPKVGAPPVFASRHGNNDSRGVNVASDADPAEAGTGLPGSVLGNAPGPSSNLGPTRGMSALAGFEAAPSQSTGGVQVGAVGAVAPTLEDPHGRSALETPAPPVEPNLEPPAAIG